MSNHETGILVAPEVIKKSLDAETAADNYFQQEHTKETRDKEAFEAGLKVVEQLFERVTLRVSNTELRSVYSKHNWVNMDLGIQGNPLTAKGLKDIGTFALVILKGPRTESENFSKAHIMNAVNEALKLEDIKEVEKIIVQKVPSYAEGVFRGTMNLMVESRRKYLTNNAEPLLELDDEEIISMVHLLSAISYPNSIVQNDMTLEYFNDLLELEESRMKLIMRTMEDEE